jgi:uncharacterized membrane protein YfcA
VKKGVNMETAISLGIGIAIGVISGLIGLGGGVFLIPILVYGYGMDQHRAQGTSIATLLLPIGALAFWKYYGAGNVDVKVAALMAVGFFVGGYFGGAWAQAISTVLLRRIFAGCLVAIAVKMFVQK